MATRLFFVCSVVVSFAACQVAEKGPNYGGRGLKIILKPTIKGPPEDILWKHNGSKVMEFDGSEERVYGTYTDRVVLDWHTAELTLKDLRHEDSGHYELEVTVNKMLHTLHHNVEVIDVVDEPSISCVMNDTSGGHASLLCSAEPRGPPSLMTFDWRLPGDESRPGPELPISVRGEDDTVYTCGVRNPVSEKTATFSAKDCFQGESSLPWIIPLIIICCILLVTLVIVLVWYYCKRKQGAEKTNTDDVESQPSEGNKPTKQDKMSRHSRDATLPSNQPLARLAKRGSEEKTDKDQEKEPLLSKGNVLDKVKIYEDLSPTKVARPEDPDQGTVKRTETNQTETEAQASEGTNKPVSKSEDPSCDPNPDVNHKQPEPIQSREEADTPEPSEYQDDTEEPAHASDSTEQTSAQIVQMKADDEDMQPSHSTPEENIGLGNGQIPVLLNETPKEKEEQTPTEQNHTTKKTPFPDVTQPEDINSEPKGDAGPDQGTVKPTETEPETESQALEGTNQPVSKPEEPSSDPDPDVNQKQPEPSQEEENTPEPSKDQDDAEEPAHASQHQSESTEQTSAQTVQMKADDEEEMQPPHSTPEDEVQSPTEPNYTTKKTLFLDVTQPEDVASEPKGDAGLDQDTVKPTETEPETESQALEGTNQPVSKPEEPSSDPDPDVNQKQPEPSQEEENTPEPSKDQDDTVEPAHASQHVSESTQQTSAQTVQMKADDEEMQPPHSTPEDETQSPTEQNHATKKTLFPDVTQPEDVASEPKGDAGLDQDTVKPTETEPETESQALEGTNQPVSKPEEPSSDPDPDVNQKQPEPSQEEENTPEPSKDQDDTVEPVHASQHQSESTQQTSAQTVQMKADDEEMQPPHSTPEDEAQSPTEQNHTTKKTLFPDVIQPEDVAREPKGDAGPDQDTVKPTETEPETLALEGTNQPVSKPEEPSSDPDPDVNQKQAEPEGQSQEEANASEPSGDQDAAEEPAHASQPSDSTEKTSAQTVQMKADGEEMQPPHSTPEGHVTDEAESPTEQNHTTKKTLFPDVTQPEDVASEPKGDAGPDQDTVKPTETTEPETESQALEGTNQPVSKPEDPSCGPNPDVNQKQPEPSQSQEEAIITEPSKDQDDAVEPVHASQHESDSTGFEETNASDIVIKSDEPIKESNQPPSSLNHGDEITPHPDHEIEDNYKLDESEGSQTDLYTAGAQEHEAQPGQSREEPCNEKMTGDNEEGEVSQNYCSNRPGQGGDMGAHGDSDTEVETEDVKDISQDVDEQVNAHSVSADVENVNVTGVGHGQEKAERRDEADNEDQIEKTEQEAKEKEIGRGNDVVKGESGESEGNNEPDSVSKSVDPKCELDPPPQGPTIPDQPGQNPQHPEPESKMAPEENIPAPSMVQGVTGHEMNRLQGANTQAITSSLSTKTEDGNIAGDQAKVEMCDKGAEASNGEKEAKEKEMEVGQNKGENDKPGEEHHNLTESQEEE